MMSLRSVSGGWLVVRLLAHEHLDEAVGAKNSPSAERASMTPSLNMSSRSPGCSDVLTIESSRWPNPSGNPGSVTSSPSEVAVPDEQRCRMCGAQGAEGATGEVELGEDSGDEAVVAEVA